MIHGHLSVLSTNQYRISKELYRYNEEYMSNNVWKGIIPAYMATAIYGGPCWLVYGFFAEQNKAIIQQEPGVLATFIFMVCFVVFVNFRVYTLAMQSKYTANITSWLKIAIIGPWFKVGFNSK